MTRKELSKAIDDRTPCLTCNGTGVIYGATEHNELCDKCYGLGTTYYTETIKSESPKSEFRNACLPLIKYLAENGNPHTTVIVTQTGAELLQGKQATGEVLDFLKDQ